MFGVWGLVCGAWGLRCGIWVWGLGCGVWDFFGVCVLEFGVESSGSKVEGLGFRA